jgi:DnaJ-class molecular chaperone
VLLTPEGRRAIEVLNALGAHLTGSPSRIEVRRAFRTLARRYHPDRHTGRNAGDLALLARSFAAATDAYRRLIAEIDGCSTH